MIKTIQIKRGDLAALPSEALEGELLFAKDVNQVYIGKGDGVEPVQIGGDFSSVVQVDSTGKIDPAVLPALAISETYVVDSETAQLEQDVQEGDIAVRTDENKSYINVTGNNDSMDDWQELLTPTDSVLSVNGKTGAVVLDTDDIEEGDNNLYYTDDRAIEAAKTLDIKDLSDTPDDDPDTGVDTRSVLVYEPEAGKWVYDEVDDIGRTDFIDLDDTPDSYDGAAGYSLRVNSDGTAVEFVDDSVVDGGTF